MLQILLPGFVLLYHTMHYCIIVSVQPSAPVPVKMEGSAQLLTLAHVMWGGLECSVKQVCHAIPYIMYSILRLITDSTYG